MENILVYRTGQLGDTICAIPALNALTDNFNQCKLVLLSDIHPGNVYPRAHEVLLEFGLIDDYIAYNPGDLLSPKVALGLRRQIILRKIRRAVYFGQRHRRLAHRIRDFIFFKSCGIKQLYGLRLLNDMSHPSSGKHEAERLMDLLRLEGFIVPMEPCFNLQIREDVILKVNEMWVERGWEQKKIIAIAPGSKMPVKRWASENYKEVGIRLIESYGVHLLILGGIEDRSIGETLRNTWGGKCTDLAGKTSYAESAEILRRCVLYLGNDTGVMHMAAAVRIPCVAIFSARDAAGEWYPYGKGHVVLRREVKCQGCMLTECIEENMKCIKSISIDEVLAACKQILISSRIS